MNTKKLKEIIDTPAKELYEPTSESTNINWNKAFLAQQNTIRIYIDLLMENELNTPKFKSNQEKNEWFKKQLLVNKYDYVKNA